MDFIKNKNFCALKNILKTEKRQTTKLKKIFVTYIRKIANILNLQRTFKNQEKNKNQKS